MIANRGMWNSLHVGMNKSHEMFIYVYHQILLQILDGNKIILWKEWNKSGKIVYIHCFYWKEGSAWYAPNLILTRKCTIERHWHVRFLVHVEDKNPFRIKVHTTFWWKNFGMEV